MITGKRAAEMYVVARDRKIATDPKAVAYFSDLNDKLYDAIAKCKTSIVIESTSDFEEYRAGDYYKALGWNVAVERMDLLRLRLGFEPKEHRDRRLTTTISWIG